MGSAKRRGTYEQRKAAALARAAATPAQAEQRPRLTGETVALLSLFALLKTQSHFRRRPS